MLTHAGYMDYGQYCNVSDLQLCWQYAHEKPNPTIQEFRNLADNIIEEEALSTPATPMEGLILYLDLMHYIES
jgi:hypothetical protein